MKKLLLSLCIPGIVLASAHSNQTLSYTWAKAETQGDRDYMEDTSQILTSKPTNQSFFAVFDGHGGNFASRAAVGTSSTAKQRTIQAVPELLLTSKSSGRYRLEDAFLKFEQQFLARGDTSGTTAVAALLEQQAKTWMLYLAWTGDSRAVLFNKDGKVRYETVDHKFKGEELKRVQNAGGKVESGRVAGLAIPRSLGDKLVKEKAGKGVIIADPDLKKIVLLPQDNFLILASDGVWDNISSQEAAQIVHNAYYNKKHYQDEQINSGKEVSGSNNAIKRAAKALMDEAYRWSRIRSDNISVVVIKLNWPKENVLQNKKANVYPIQHITRLTFDIQKVLQTLYKVTPFPVHKKYIAKALSELSKGNLEGLKKTLAELSRLTQQNINFAKNILRLEIVLAHLINNKFDEASKEMAELKRKCVDK